MNPILRTVVLTISRDERNKYHGVTVGWAMMLLDLLGAIVSSTIEVSGGPIPGKIAV